MSTTIDQRVVEMRFDNKNFETNVASTMSTLEKFKRSLNLNGATKGLEEINAATKNFYNRRSKCISTSFTSKFDRLFRNYAYQKKF